MSHVRVNVQNLRTLLMVLMHRVQYTIQTVYILAVWSYSHYFIGSM